MGCVWGGEARERWKEIEGEEGELSALKDCLQSNFV